MKYYLVKYRGLWHGGTAVVKAEDEKSAIKFVMAHKSTVNFESPTAEEIKIEEGVLYNDNGNY